MMKMLSITSFFIKLLTKYDELILKQNHYTIFQSHDKLDVK